MWRGRLFTMLATIQIVVFVLTHGGAHECLSPVLLGAFLVFYLWVLFFVTCKGWG
jgi:hypothetical protein